MWMYCPGYTGVKGNDRTDTMAGKAAITSGLRLGRSEVLRSLRYYLWAQSQRTTCWHKAKDINHRLPGGERRSSLKGREKANASQTNVGTVSKATLGKLLRDGMERIWAFSSAQTPS